MTYHKGESMAVEKMRRRGFENEAERLAIIEKYEHPEKKVRCPRCGAELIYEERGNSIAVECENQPCVFGGLRGL